jgi:hypothetical protein
MSRRKTYNDEDFISVLTETPTITKTVQKRLHERNNKLYKYIHYDTVRKTLIRLLAEGKIGGGLHEELNVYLWSKKDKQENTQ